MPHPHLMPQEQLLGKEVNYFYFVNQDLYIIILYLKLFRFSNGPVLRGHIETNPFPSIGIQRSSVASANIRSGGISFDCSNFRLNESFYQGFSSDIWN